jgi:hypothetical protein
MMRHRTRPCDVRPYMGNRKSSDADSDSEAEN